jgi:hypothetical protein
LTALLRRFGPAVDFEYKKPLMKCFSKFANQAISFIAKRSEKHFIKGFLFWRFVKERLINPFPLNRVWNLTSKNSMFGVTAALILINSRLFLETIEFRRFS